MHNRAHKQRSHFGYESDFLNRTFLPEAIPVAGDRGLHGTGRHLPLMTNLTAAEPEVHRTQPQ